MIHYNFYISEQHMNCLKQLSEQTNESSAEWLRRMVGYCMRQEVICNLVPPYLSGQIQVGTNR